MGQPEFGVEKGEKFRSGWVRHPPNELIHAVSVSILRTMQAVVQDTLPPCCVDLRRAKLAIGAKSDPRSTRELRRKTMPWPIRITTSDQRAEVGGGEEEFRQVEYLEGGEA